jgi:hypothetical protein
MMGEMAICFRTEASRADMNVYFKHLRDCSLYQVGRAIKEIIDTRDRFPTVSQIKLLAKSFLIEKSAHVQEENLIEASSVVDDLPKTKEEFFEAMRNLCSSVDVRSKNNGR